MNVEYMIAPQKNLANVNKAVIMEKYYEKCTVFAVCHQEVFVL